MMIAPKGNLIQMMMEMTLIVMVYAMPGIQSPIVQAMIQMYAVIVVEMVMIVMVMD